MGYHKNTGAVSKIALEQNLFHSSRNRPNAVYQKRQTAFSAKFRRYAHVSPANIHPALDADAVQRKGAEGSDVGGGQAAVGDERHVEVDRGAAGRHYVVVQIGAGAAGGVERVVSDSVPISVVWSVVCNLKNGQSFINLSVLQGGRPRSRPSCSPSGPEVHFLSPQACTLMRKLVPLSS